MKEEELFSNDRRLFPRFKIALPLKCVDLNLNNEFKTHTYDISADGLGIVINQHLSAGTILQICIIMPDTYEEILRKGRVIWSKRIDSDYRIGIKLESPGLNATSLVLRTVDYRIKSCLKQTS
ncbi:MAG: PilZ domain-containing protein [Candidatus Omnitrophica bacterium]|nr:PilZ domain-containing protein [Candidatus Omnitrophota bacterium]